MHENPFRPPGADLSSPETFENPGEISDRVLDGLARTKGWVKLASTLLFIIFALTVISSVITLAGVGQPKNLAKAIAITNMIGGIVSLLFAFILILLPALRLRAYTKGIEALLAAPDAVKLEHALDAQRGFWKLIGIVTLIYFIVIFAVFFVAAFVGATGALR